VSNKLLGKVCLALKNSIYLPSDVILHKGEYGHEMYIIRKGTVQILAKVADFANPIMLQEGSFFGEMALVLEVRRTVSVEAKTMCELCLLQKEAFEFVISEYVCIMPLYISLLLVFCQ
jgi:CRP-like cAMP-binding protein